MSDIYDSLGLETLVNAYGPVTRFGGGIMAPEVAAAMALATRHSVDIPELQARASRIIAGITGAEAGCVTSGASAAVLAGTAACVSGLDPGKMNRLPDTNGMRNEVVVIRSQRNAYEIGRASCREEVGISGVAVPLNNRSHHSISIGN